MSRLLAWLLLVGVLGAAAGPYHGPEGVCGAVGVCRESSLAQGCVDCMRAVGELAQQYQAFGAYAELGLGESRGSGSEGRPAGLRAKLADTAEELLVKGAAAVGPGHEAGSYGPFSIPAYAVCAKVGECTDGDAFCPSQARAREDASSLAPLFAARNAKAAALISAADDELSSGLTAVSESLPGQLGEAAEALRAEVTACVEGVTLTRGKVDEVNSELQALEERARNVATTPRLKEVLRSVNTLREELERTRARTLSVKLGPHPDHPQCLCPATAALGMGSGGSLERGGASGSLPENPLSTSFTTDNVVLSVPSEPTQDCYPENAVCGCCGSLHFSPLVSYDRQLRHLEVRVAGEIRKLKQCRAAKAATEMVLADAISEKQRFGAEVTALGDDVEAMIAGYENQLSDLETLKNENAFSVSAMTGSIYGKMDECLSDVAMCQGDDDDSAGGDDEEGGEESLLQLSASTTEASAVATSSSMRATTRNMSERRCKICEEYMCHYTMFMMYTNMDSIRESLWASFKKHKKGHANLLKGVSDSNQKRADMKWRQLEFNDMFKAYKCPATDNPSDCETWTESLTRLTLAGDYIIEKFLAGCMDDGKKYGPYQCPFYSMCRRAYLDTSNGNKGTKMQKAAYCTKENLPTGTDCPEGDVSSQTYKKSKKRFYDFEKRKHVQVKVKVSAKAARESMKKKGKKRFALFERNRDEIAQAIERDRAAITKLQAEIPKLEAQLDKERSAIEEMKGALASDRELAKARSDLDETSKQVLAAAAQYDLIQGQIRAARGWSGCLEERTIGDVDCLCLKVEEDGGGGDEGGFRMLNGPSWQRGTGGQLGSGGSPGGDAAINRLASEVEKQSDVVPSLPADKLRKYRSLLEKAPASEDEGRGGPELSDSELDDPPLEKIFRLIGNACTAQIEEQWCGPHQTLNPLRKGTGDPSVMMLRSQNRRASDLGSHKKGLEEYRRSLQSQLAAMARAKQRLEEVMLSEKSAALQSLQRERDGHEYQHALLKDAIARATAQLVSEMGKKKAKEEAAFSQVKECYDRLKAGALPDVSAS